MILLCFRSLLNIRKCCIFKKKLTLKEHLIRKMKYYTIHKTVIGNLLIAFSDNYLTNIFFNPDKGLKQLGDEFIEEKSRCLNVTTQLDLYFEGKLSCFQVKMKPKGTEFQKKAWKVLVNIPYGKTLSYSEQAEILGNPRAMRAVGNANGKNPIPIIIPCHRVIKSDGSPGGYSSGESIKKTLLDLESSV